MSVNSSGRHFVDLLLARCERSPDRVAFTLEAERREASDIVVTYGQLVVGARRVAAALGGGSLSGRRVLLLIPPGGDYLVALFGCWFVGAAAVPLYPPRDNASSRRFKAVAMDCDASVAIVSQAALPLLVGVFEESVRLVTIESITNSGQTLNSCEMADMESLAVLQYTSGSTGAPKGVRLRHRQLVENSRILTRMLGTSSESVGVTWLPPYHDMGLVGGLLQPLHAGFPVHVMSPALFLQRPLRWLEAITRRRATVSAAPNFAFDLCVRRATPDRVAQLNLSSWQVACNGAEPIRPETLRAFEAAFAEAGFDGRAFMPCFGLAEATLMVTAAPRFGGARCEVFDRRRLEMGALLPPGPNDDRIELVSSGFAATGVDLRIVDTTSMRACAPGEARGSGFAATGVDLRIVDTTSMRACAPGEVGEIWVAGETVADGYWCRPEATREVFEGVLEGEGRRWLRTGDLGALVDGELFVAGRLKDLIVIRGGNHYPQDLEATALAAHPMIRPRGAVAFAIAGRQGESLGLILELERGWQSGDLAAVRAAVTEAISREHQLQIGHLALVRANAVPRTSSGKVERLASRARLLAGDFDLIDVEELE